MAISLRLGLIAVWALVSGALLPANAPAQDYPKRPITVIVPFAVGGLTDVPVRVLAGMLQERIGQTIVVENKPGGVGHAGRGVCGSVRARWLHTVRQFDRRRAKSIFSSGAI
jgi:tripartite-type tricarboxylate transporter receptor subunit TctC